jgi:CO/xanthine dehydrogenase FAD-binding subunit
MNHSSEESNDMALPDLKEFCTPQSPGEVADLFARYDDSALIVAGGTFLHGLEARGFLNGTEALIDLRNLGLDAVRAEKGGIHMGASANFAAVAALPDIDGPAHGALRDALAYPPQQIMNLATVGGSIASACPFFDIPAALQVLDGEVSVTGSKGERKLPVGEMYAGMFENTLEPGEFITRLFLPKQDKRAASAYLKLETNANDLALVGVAVRITLGWRDKISDARVVLGGGLNDTFIRSEAAEQVLNGARPDAEVFTQAAQAINDCISPISDHRCSAEYRAEIGRVYVRRALERAAKRLAGEDV